MAGGSLSIDLDPPLTGVTAELRHRSYGIDELVITFTINGSAYISGSQFPPANVYAVRIPEQTINGITYAEAETHQFTFQGDVEVTITLTPVTEPPPTPSYGFLIFSLLPVGIGVVLLLKTRSLTSIPPRKPPNLFGGGIGA